MANETSVTTPDKPIRVLVIQLARLGDTLQSLMALRAAKQLYPNLEITFVARDRFSSAARRTPWIKQVFTLPTDDIIGPVLSGTGSEQEAIRALATWVEPLIEAPWDLVVNWSYSEASSWLTALVPGHTKLGFSRRNEMGSVVCADGWSQYIQGIVHGGIRQNIHLTDILTTQLLTALQLQIGDPEADGNAPVTSKSFFALELKEIEAEWCAREFVSRRFIGIQLGTGRTGNPWSPENWARVAAKILKSHPECSIVLLGGKDDVEAGARFKAELKQVLGVSILRNVISLVGNSSFDLWASVVSKCSWVFAAETAVIHLASVLGTRVLTVGAQKWFETGPYGNGHYVVNPFAGAETISPDAVYATWSYASSEWSHRRNIDLESHFEKLGMSAELSRVSILRSKIRSTNDGGGVFYEGLISQRPLVLEDWNAMMLGHVARAWYCGWVPPAGQELTREMLDPVIIKQLRELQESADVLTKICEQARTSAQELNRRSKSLKSPRLMKVGDREELHAIGQKLAELDDLVDRLGKAHSPMTAFSRMARILMHNLSGNDLKDLGRESAEAYRQVLDGSAVLKDWIKASLALVRPMAIVRDVKKDAPAPLPLL